MIQVTLVPPRYASSLLANGYNRNNIPAYPACWLPEATTVKQVENLASMQRESDSTTRCVILPRTPLR